MACKDLGPDGGVVKVPGGGLLIAGGLAVPASGVSGYSAGCVFHQLDGAAGSTLYLNEGTLASANFKRVVSAKHFDLTYTSISGTTTITGGDTVDAGAVLTAIQLLEARVNAILVACQSISA